MNGKISPHFERKVTQPDKDFENRLNNLYYFGYKKVVDSWSSCDNQMLYDGRGQATISGEAEAMLYGEAFKIHNMVLETVDY